MQMWTEHLDQADQVLLRESQGKSGSSQITNQVPEAVLVGVQRSTRIVLPKSYFFTHGISGNTPQRRAD